MKIKNFIIIPLIIFACSFFVYSQTAATKTPAKSELPKPNAAAKSTAAYAELLLRRTERESELEEFALDYKDDFPKIKEIKFELDLLQKEMDKITATSAADFDKLTLALGKLMVRKTELETDLWNLRRQYSDDHPEVKRAKRKVEVFEKAIKEILP